MLKIQNSLSRKSNCANFVGIIYGTSGIGKTNLAATAPKPLFVDFEFSTRFFELNGVDADVVDIATWKEVGASIAEIAASNYETIVIDSMTSALECLRNEMSQEDKKAGRITNVQPNGLLTLAGYQVAEIRLKAMMKAFADMKGKNIIFNAHAVTKTIDDVAKIVPQLVKKDSDSIIGSYYINHVGCITRPGTLSFKSTNAYYAKDSSGKLLKQTFSGDTFSFQSILKHLETPKAE